MNSVEAIHHRGTGVRARLCSMALFGLLLSPLAGCGPVGEPSTSSVPDTLAREVVTGNGLSFNGLSFNGLSFNGLSFNGLSFNGLSSSAFHSWFRTAPPLADMVMRYVVRCAVASGKSRTYTDPVTGHTYTWEGGLGLAPAWASGSPATKAEQELISACLAAHANKYEVNVPLSVLGRDSQGAVIPYTSGELDGFPVREACFFGNLFRDSGLHVGSEGNLLGDKQSSVRACSLANRSGGVRAECPPLQYVGHCSDWCVLDGSGLFYTSCTYEGATYRPLTTRLRDREISTCGDKVCQVSESCGTSLRYDDCRDCGSCG